jgi:ATP-binding cassette, subfamily F, member 3
MIQIINLSKEYSSNVLFENATFSLKKSEKVGIVGRNGCGKSTLMKIIMGAESSSSGEVQIPKNYKLAWLEQHIHFTHPTVLSEVSSVLASPELEEYKSKKILNGLGFDDQQMLKSPQAFSGGYQLRINLAKAILKEPDLLLLDEPTNYLDIGSIRWLKRFLRDLPCEVMIISHDRDFIDDVCGTIVGIHRKKLYRSEGNTEKFYNSIMEEEELYLKTKANQDKKIAETKRFIERFKAKANKASQAQSRAKMLAKMDVLEDLTENMSYNLRFQYANMPAKTICEIRDLSFAYPNGATLFEKLNFPIMKGDRIGIIGRNGIGKSTLLALIAGELQPVAGSISHHAQTLIGYFGQTNISRLNTQNTILQEVVSVSQTVSPQQARDVCGSLLFKSDDVDKKIAVLSGGERSRVLLAKIMCEQKNLLLLDEPTNHLDQESIEIMLEELQEFEGASVLVAHSEYLIDQYATKLVVFDAGKVEVFNGPYADFKDKIGWSDDIKTEDKNSKVANKDYKRIKAEYVQKRSTELRPIRKEIEQLEALVDKLEKERPLVEEKLIAASHQSQAQEIEKQSKRLNEIDQQIEVSFERLGLLYEQEKAITDHYQALIDQV